MKKKLLTLVLLCTLMSTVFALGPSDDLPDKGNEVIVMIGSTIVWHAKDWTMNYDYYFEIYTFKGTPMKDSTIQWTEYSVIGYEDLTLLWK